MRLSEIKGDDALDVLAEIIEPIADITADDEFIKLTKSEVPKAKIVAYVIKNHKQEVVRILAALELKKPEEYEFTLLTLPRQLMELFEDEEVMALFT